MLLLIPYFQVVTTGNLKAQLNQQGKIDMLELGVLKYSEYVQRNRIVHPPESPEQKPSPNITKGNKKAAAQQRTNRQQASEQARLSIPKAPLSEFCIPTAVFQLLEVSHHCRLDRFALMGPRSLKHSPIWKPFLSFHEAIPAFPAAKLYAN